MTHMTIRDYYKNYAMNSEYPVEIPSGFAATVEDFYKDCISQNNLDKENVLAWHKMFMEYAERPDAIYWIRYYENGNKDYRKTTGLHNNRRACMTSFADGFSYVFVSNYDVHEIFNMIRLGVKPNVDEFADMMNHRTAINSDYRHFPDAFPMHYDPGKSCEESNMNCYPNIGDPRQGVLGGQGWYLAHIVEIKSKFKRSDGIHRVLSNDERNLIFPRGVIADWKPDASGIMIRNIDRMLDYEYKQIVKAHFLRFVDPLNYYIAPGEKSQQNETPYGKTKKSIGEYDPLNMFMARQFETLYGEAAMDEFRKAALLDVPSEKLILNVTYGAKPSAKSTKSSAKSAKSSASKPRKTRSGSVPRIIFDPPDEETFKRELLKTKRATVIWVYNDGAGDKEEEKIWKAENFTEESNLRSNITSKKKWRELNGHGLIEVRLKIE